MAAAAAVAAAVAAAMAVAMAVAVAVAVEAAASAGSLPPDGWAAPGLRLCGMTMWIMWPRPRRRK